MACISIFTKEKLQFVPIELKVKTVLNNDSNDALFGNYP